MDNDPLEFSLELETIPVTIAGDSYVLTELDGRQRDKHIAALARRMKNVKGEQRLTNYDGLQASLIAMSLFRIEDGQRVAVSSETIQTWPSKVVRALHEKAAELSGLDVQDDEEGND